METDPEVVAKKVNALEEQLRALPEDASLRAELAWALTDLARAQRDLGDRPRAERTFRRVLELRTAIARDTASRTARRDLARTHTDLGWLVEKITRHDEAEACHRAALALREALHAEAPEDPEATSELAASYRYLATVAQDAGRNAEALDFLARSAALLEAVAAKTTGSDERVTLLSDLAWTRRSEAWLLERLGRARDHERAMRAAAEIHAKLLAANPVHEDRALWQAKLGDQLGQLGRFLEQADRFEEAEAALDEAIAALEAALAADLSPGAAELATRDLHQALRALELVLHGQRRPADALAARQRAKAVARRLRRS